MPCHVSLRAHFITIISLFCKRVQVLLMWSLLSLKMMHSLYSKTIRLYVKSNLVVSLRIFILMEEKSIWESLMTIFRKTVSPTKLLLLTHLNKTGKPKKLTTPL